MKAPESPESVWARVPLIAAVLPLWIARESRCLRNDVERLSPETGISLAPSEDEIARASGPILINIILINIILINIILINIILINIILINIILINIILINIILINIILINIILIN